MDGRDMLIFSFHFFYISYGYVILIYKYKKYSLKDLLNYKPPKGLIYSKIKIETN